MMSSTKDDQIVEVIRRYVSLLATGSTDDLLELFAEDATVEDPVGSDVRAGRNEIREFFSTLQQL